MGDKGKNNGGLVISLIVSAIYSFILVYVGREQLRLVDGDKQLAALAFILGTLGAFVTLIIVKAIMKRFIFFTRDPVKFYLTMYVVWPIIGTFIGLFLYSMIAAAQGKI